jgi:hypothetical protein
LLAFGTTSLEHLHLGSSKAPQRPMRATGTEIYFQPRPLFPNSRRHGPFI